MRLPARAHWVQISFLLIAWITGALCPPGALCNEEPTDALGGMKELKEWLSVREGMFGDRPISARITFNERKRASRAGPFRTKVQVIDATWAGPTQGRIDMLEEPAYSLGWRTRERIIMTCNPEGCRVLSRGRGRDPKEPDGLEKDGSVMMGRVSRQTGLWWAISPTELLQTGLFSPTEVLFSEVARVEAPSREQVDGHGTLRVQWSADSANPPGSAFAGVYWFAPDLGYAPVRIERTRRPTPGSPWKKIAEFHCEGFKLVSGIWLPQKVALVAHSYWDDGSYELERELDAVFENWAVADKIDEKVFRLEFPKGTWVTDRVRGGSTYVKGRIDDPEVKRQVVLAKALASQKAQVPPLPAGMTERLEETTASSRFAGKDDSFGVVMMVAAVAVVGATAVSVYVIRRRKLKGIQP